MATCELRVSNGVMKGKVLTSFDGKKYYSFEGIPYAKPPIGELRFRNPEPPEDWNGVKDCTKPGSRCAQINPYASTGFTGSEDCLYLNVYTPCLPAEKIAKLPVLFFIHGGRLLLGYGDYYRPDFFLRHDVILVTVNYRLGILGFLCLDIPEAPGNAAMKDCVMALRWVNKNIAYFNGDRDNVTVSGESAGAAIASAFLTSPMTSSGLFSKLITQSGNCLADVFHHTVDHVAAASGVASILGKDLTDSRSIYEFFKDLPVETLIEAGITTEMQKPPYSLAPTFLPVVEKDNGVEIFWNEPPVVSLKNNNFIKVPTLNGSTTCEGAIFVRRDGDNVLISESDLQDLVPQSLYLSKTDPKRQRVIEMMKRYYQPKDPKDAKLQMVKMFSDSVFQRTLVTFSELLAKHNVELYMYDFLFVGNLNVGVEAMKALGIPGTSHGDMLQYLFYRSSKIKKCNDRDMKMISLLSECWCNFIKYGKPTWTNQSVVWKPYTNEEKLTLFIDDQLTLKRNEDFENSQFWDNLYERKAKL